ncbi:MAG: CBS domain-containing protein [Pirellulaceae bacterium]
MFESGLSTLVTYNPWTVSEDAPLDELLRLLDDLGVHHLPVTDDDGKMAGIVSEIDILRAVEERHAAAMATVGAEAIRTGDHPVFAREIMQRRVIVVGNNDSPRTALKKMLAGDVHSCPVTEQGRPVGIVTSTDFLREFSYGEASLSRQPVTTLMEDAGEAIDVEATLDEANRQFWLTGANYLAVEQGDFPLGVVSRRSVRSARCRDSARQILGDAVLPGPATIAQLVSEAPSVSPGSRLAKAAELLVESRLQAVAVVNQANRLLGVLSENRLLHAMLEHMK